MDKNKKQIVMRLIIVLLVGMNFIFLIQSRDQKKIVEGYIGLYSSQVLIKEDGREKLAEGIDGGSSFFREYEYYLTDDFINRLIEHKRLPEFSLIDYGIEKGAKSYEIANMRIRGKGKNTYDARYDIVVSDSDGNKENIHHEETYALKKVGSEYKINAIGIKVKNIGEQQ